MASIQNITFPEENEIVLPPRSKLQSKIKTPPALDFVRRLLYRSGTGLSLVYILLIIVIQPLLEVQYDRRLKFSQHVLKRARGILRWIGQSRQLPVVAVRHGDKLYSDAYVQTEPQPSFGSSAMTRGATSIVSFKDEFDGTETPIADRLVKLTSSLADYNKYCCEIDELGPLTFQLRKFQGTIEGYSHASLFKTGRLMAGKSSGSEIKGQIRTIKGWYLTGQV